MDQSAKSQIVRLLSVVTAGIAAAVIIAWTMLFTHGVSGTYLAGNVILAPNVATQLNFQDKATKFVYDHVELSYFDAEQKQFRKVSLSEDQYAKFYQLVKADRSEANGGEDVVAQFSENNPATMVVSVRTKSSNVQESIVSAFQEIGFVNEGDYYRVELHQENVTSDWAYFYHQGIYQELMKLIAQ